ncbi:hypothetical protein C0585_00040 [Candidatus Woesearchaeota archaeon]|mgnify:CR=1 FL=1|nr:MAG: hypothetical protein C0585_00040 [Candidatus Woesearchaeota archaeon]
MEQETLFTSSKWDILKVLSKGPKSPLELAKETRTSIANISQQLRLLELGGLVNKNRISNRDKDQPRLVYSLGGHRSFIINLSQGFVEKELVELKPYQQFSMRSWFTKDETRKYFVEKYYWKELDDNIDQINAIALRNEYSTLRLFIICEKTVRTKIKKATLSKDEVSVVVEPEFYTEEELSKIPRQDLEILYDPKNILNTKGGGY